MSNIYTYATQDLKDLINHKCNIEDLLTDNKNNNYKCPECDKYALRAYSDNLSYCHSCQITFDYVNLYALVNNINQYKAILNITKNVYDVKLNKNVNPIKFSTYQQHARDHYYLRHVRLYLDYYGIKLVHDMINEIESTFRRVIKYDIDNLTKNQIKRVTYKLRQLIPEYEIDYFALKLKLTDYDANLSKLYLISNNIPIKTYLTNIGINYRTFLRATQGHKIRSLDNMLLMFKYNIGKDNLYNFVRLIGNIDYDIEAIKDCIGLGVL